MSNDKAFCYPYPDDSDHPAWNERLRGTYMLWTQSPNGMFMLLSGGWPSEHSAKIFAGRMGYTMIDPDRGMALLDAQMAAKFGRPQLRVIQ